MPDRKQRTDVGGVYGRDGVLGGAGRSFFEVKLPAPARTELSRLLSLASDPAGRRWVTIAADYDDPNRLRVTQKEAPAYESGAARTYLRGDVLRVRGVAGRSVSVDLSSRFAVESFRALLDEAGGRSREFVLLRVRSRKRDLIELVPDLDLTAHHAAHEPLAEAGAALAGEVLPAEEFGDWEGAGG